MRQMTLVIELNERAIREQSSMFQFIESFEVLETLKIDYDKGMYVDLIECVLREGLSIRDLGSIGKMEVLNVLRSEGNKHVCLVRGQESLDPSDHYKELDLDLIWTKPSVISADRVTVSCIGLQKDLLKFIDLVKSHVGEISNMTFKRAVYQSVDILSILTDKQKEIMTAAHRYGYYKYPRKINADELSKKVDLSRATLVEHLRKAEVRILDELLTGYS
jgi:hypothetical protein